ncbi:BQ00720 family protein [Bosea thiooxidans]
MKQDRILTQTNPLTPAEFAALGTGEVAYVKPMTSDELMRIFPQAPKIEPGLRLFTLLSADGAPILVTDSREAATANAWEHDLKMVSVH